MKRGVVVAGALLLALGLGGSQVLAQGAMKWRGSGGWGAGLPYGRLYDAAAVQTLRGKVLRLERLTPRQGMSDGLHLLLKTRDETVSVHLGPVWYLERQDFPLAPGDAVEAVGARIPYDGATALIAAEVRKDDKELRLRETSGFPLWSGWRRR